MAFAAQLDDGPFGHIGREGFAVPVLPVGDFTEAPAFLGPGQDHCRAVPAQVARLGEGRVDRGDVVTVDLEDSGTEGFGSAGVGGRGPRTSSVGPRWPSRLMSTMATRLDRW